MNLIRETDVNDRNGDRSLATRCVGGNRESCLAGIGLPLLAQTAPVVGVDPAAAGVGTTREIVYEFGRAGMLGGWWGWAIAILVVASLTYLCVQLYRRDTTELRPGVRVALIALRLTVLAALVFFFLGLQRRAQQRVTRPSEVAILVDTSQSMSLAESNDPGAAPLTRAARAARIVGEGDLLDELSAAHRVTVYAFDENAEPRELESRDLVAVGDAAPQAASGVADNRPNRVAMLGALAAVGMLLLCLAAFVLAIGGRAAAIGAPLVGAVALLLVAAVLLGGVWAVHSDRSLASLLGIPSATNANAPTMAASDAEENATTAAGSDVGTEPTSPRRVEDWSASLSAVGSQTRLGDAIRGVLTRHDPTTLAGLLLVSDGQANGGLTTSAAAALARRSEVAIHSLGLGSSDAPTNVRVVDLDAPRRVYPGDKFALSAVLQASGSQTITAEVQLLDGLDDSDAALTEVIDSRQVEIPADGSLLSVRFEMSPETVGRRRLGIRVVPPSDDRNREDDQREARYEVVARKLKVLAIAGGPTREYQFVRNLLFRDESVDLSVWLQTAQAGLSQDADELLTEFPATAEELFEYDAIIAFDPDWMQIPAERLQLLQRWLSEQAGGLVLVGGPIYMPQWTRMRTDPRVAILGGMFPVDLATRSPVLASGRQGGETAFDLEFTPEASRADFLFIADDPQTSFQVWGEFGGVYDYVGVKDAKPGAKVYAYFSDPSTKIGDSLPVYLASQFYGAGRTYFQASGEMWRLRRENDAYFDSYYTKLIRWISEGRLLRDSNRGVLLVDNPRAGVGDTITVRAILTDDQFEPLRLPKVEASLLGPGGLIQPVILTPVEGESREGTYGGRFVVRAAGSYDLRLTLGDGLNDTVLRQSVQVRLPTAELERPQRNDEDLAFVAESTGGTFFKIDDEDSAQAASSRLLELVQPQPQTTILPGTPDDKFAERRNASLLWLIATALTFEWVVRRLHRLA